MTDSDQPESAADHERRHEVDSRLRDRRVIERVSDPQLKKFLRFSKNLCTVGVTASIIFIVVLVGRHLNRSNLELNQAIFFSVVVAVLAFSLHHLGSSIGSYIENESKARLIIVSERLFRALFLLICSGVVLGSAYLITLF